MVQRSARGGRGKKGEKGYTSRSRSSHVLQPWQLTKKREGIWLSDVMHVHKEKEEERKKKGDDLGATETTMVQPRMDPGVGRKKKEEKGETAQD